MLRSVFIGRENLFNLVLLNWLATQTDCKGVIWADAHRHTNAWRRKWLKRSLRNDGWVTTVDRVLFKLWLSRSKEIRGGEGRMGRDVKRAYPCEGVRDQILQCWTGSLNAKPVAQLMDEARPQVVIANCISQRISKRFCERPSHGLYVLHEGITPEYKGVHSPFWALAAGDDDKVGYTLLRADERLDGGEVYVQGQTTLAPLATSLGYTGHWTLAEGFPNIARFLQTLESGGAEPIRRPGCESSYYGHFTYSGLRRIFKRRRQQGIRVAPDSVAFRSDENRRSKATSHRALH